ncbi:MAG: DksA/TraR family C4-type zinc finger protein [Pseudomonadota bacterium]
MAGGWYRDGAVQDQIDASIEDAVKLARSRLSEGSRLSEKKELTHCEECGDLIPQARRQAIPRVRLCVNCQAEHDNEQTVFNNYNRRGSKDSQLR